jgi:hypothetical protein
MADAFSISWVSANAKSSVGDFAFSSSSLIWSIVILANLEEMHFKKTHAPSDRPDAQQVLRKAKVPTRGIR